ncbi:hypothetical protein KRX52_11145 [Pseudomonas sp. MAP12]|uniref:Zorya protein ZorC EH domain-containing protein n=1 Tax=Geopseudomonas aromaticivorans TaxID=2849492 RepID=A0ABS6MX11_9GAMM|nr:EH signature domain-containing protein [Pseudomonas aromaticivorans]MBV2133349.1 hypothetical protein [Pseudomonas aromaticivorans]
MRLPPIDNRPASWPAPVIEGWFALTEKAKRMKAKAGDSDAFEHTLSRWRDMATTGRFEGLPALLRRRMGARALTSLWLNDERLGSRLLSVRMLDLLMDVQQPRLTRLTLIQLIQLYFRYFDRLDERDKQSEGMLERLQQHLHDQLDCMPEPKQPLFAKDVLSVLKREGRWLLDLHGPMELVRRVREQGRELGDAFSDYGLEGFDVGRYGDICRAYFYLDTLRGLRPGEWDPVLDELLKPSVSKAPYEDGKRIGHVALEIMIDRAADDPGESWQSFILNLAGDPRIASSASNYREWWKPLGEARISKVRGWLSKEDLRLFLQAVEQYGIETRNDDLQRMFPARKQFLEGLFKLKLIRNTRLLLGTKAQLTVRKILGSEVKTSFARMDGNMADKAVIYLDCGDFHIVEGSHSFRIWVYLAPPGAMLSSYEISTFNHADLITAVPEQYKKLYPGLPVGAYTHNPPLTWQNKVFQFLADNDIGLDIEQLLGRQDYRNYLARFGMPVVSARKVKVPPAAPMPSASTRPERMVQQELEPAWGAHTPRQRAQPVQTATRDIPQSGTPVSTASAVPSVARSIREQNRVIAESGSSSHVRSPPGAHSRPSPAPGGAGRSESDVSLKREIARLSLPTLKVLRYFASNPGDKARYAANVLDIDTREVNQLLHGPLKNLCKQDAAFGWTVTPEVDAMLNQLFP